MLVVNKNDNLLQIAQVEKQILISNTCNKFRHSVFAVLKYKLAKANVTFSVCFVKSAIYAII